MSKILEIKELQGWLQSSTTKKFITALQNARLMLLEQISRNFGDEGITKASLGKCEGLQFIIDLLNNAGERQEDLEEILGLYFFNIYHRETNNNNLTKENE